MCNLCYFHLNSYTTELILVLKSKVPTEAEGPELIERLSVALPAVHKHPMTRLQSNVMYTHYTVNFRTLCIKKKELWPK